MNTSHNPVVRLWKWWVTPPIFPEDEEKTRTVRILFVLLANILMLAAIGPLGIIFVFKQKLLPSIIVGSLVTWVLFIYVLAHRGHVKIASALFVGGIWLVVTFDQVFLIGKVNTVIAATHVSIIVLAGILLGSDSAVLVAVLSALVGLGLAVLERMGYPLNHYFPGAPLADWFNFAIALLLTITPLNLTLKLMAQSLSSAHRENEERKRAEEMQKKLIQELEQRNAELERFTYTVSHDLKSPLVTIKGFLGMLKSDIEQNQMDRIQSDMQRISGATEKMGALLSDLLELSRIGRVVNPPEKIDLTRLVNDAIELLDARIRSSNAAINIFPDLPVVCGDRIRLREVFENLIENAVKYKSDQSNPIIEIGQLDREGESVIFVRDNGIGLEEKYQTRIFGLFEKLNPASEGTGIGLALVKRIIETHGGRVWVESEGLGKGSTFCFTVSGSENMVERKEGIV